MEKQPSKRVFYGVIAFFLIAGLGFLVGGAFAWHDEHSGIPGKAHITHCVGHRVPKSLDCDGRWTYNERVVTGYVENARWNQLGKDVSVRIHGTSHATETTYWVPIGLWIGGLFVIGVFGMVLVQYRRRQVQPT